MKKKLVLISLFVLPVVAYIFFASGVYNFDSLPIVLEGVDDLDTYAVAEIDTPYNGDESFQLKDRVTIVGYLGNELKKNVGLTANLNLTVYKYYQGFEEFQAVFFVNEGSTAQAEELKEELARVTDVKKFHIIEISPEEARRHFDSLGTPLAATMQGYSPYVFIVDKELNVRSRDDDQKKTNIYGYDLTQAVETGYLKDDIKVVLADYRKALRKNNNASPKLEQRRPTKEE